MRRGTRPACIFGRRSSCGALNMRRIRDDACIFRPLRQTQLPASSTGRGRCVCPCSASPVSAAGSGSAPQPSTPRCICRRQRFGVLAPGLRARPLWGLWASNGSFCFWVCRNCQAVAFAAAAQPATRRSVFWYIPPEGGQLSRALPAAETAWRSWRSAPIFASARRGAPQKPAKRKRTAA